MPRPHHLHHSSSRRHRKPASHQHASHPRPLINFTIPSIHDDTVLNCRIYHPPYRSTISSAGSQAISPAESDVEAYHELVGQGVERSKHAETRIKGAVVAHPYAPMGGCYDDPVVMEVVETLLGKGYVVGTFNFRGAQGSQGKTSWSAKPEVGDYKSVAGLMIEYLRDLALGRTEMKIGTLETVTVDLVLGGYSYGSMVLSLLPPTSEFMKVFENPGEGTAAAEIKLRAATLAKETLKVEVAQTVTASGSESDMPSGRGRPMLKPSDALVFGGEETSPDIRRRSQEHHGARRSLDVARKSLDQVPKRVKEAVKRAGSHRSELDQQSGEEAILEEDDQLEAPRVAYTEVQKPGVSVRTRYLLVSPLLPPLSGFLSMSMSSMMPRKLGWFSHSSRSGQADGEPSKDTLASHPTLAIFGAEDGFTSGQRLSLWADRLGRRSREGQTKQDREAEPYGFDWLSVKHAGHFWREDGVKDVMRKRIEEWVFKLEGISGNA